LRQFSTVLELVGLLAVAAGAFSINTTVGLLVTGALLVVVGFFLEG
jgi:hypothetical protein